jgi:RHS repeat-associated protein
MASAYEPSWGGRSLDGIDLARGTYSPVEFDLVLPTRGPSWPIARTLAPTTRWQPGTSGSTGAFVSNTDAQGTLIGALGSRWMSSGTPTVTQFSANSVDYLIVFFGADRHVTFARNAGSSVFRGVNGAAGAAVTLAEGGINLIEVTLPDAQRFVFFAPTVSPVGGKLWKIIGPDGRTAFAGHATSPTMAITSGFDLSGRLLTATDGGGRTFTYTYTGNLLTRIEVRHPVTSNDLLASVSYTYYTGSDANGSAGELKTVSTTNRSTSDGSAIVTYDSATTLYRYANNRVRLEVRADGYRKAIADGVNLDSATDEQLKPYAWWRFLYDGNGGQSTGRLLSAEGGGSTSRVLQFSYTIESLPQTSGYDQGVKLRTLVGTGTTASTNSPLLRSDEYLFDEFGQTLGVITVEPGTTRTWVRALTRDAAGKVSRVHEPSNVASVTGQPQTPFTFHGDKGIVTRVERIDSGELQGFPRAVLRAIGNASLPALRAELLLSYWNETSPGTARVTINGASGSSVDVVRVLAREMTRFRDPTAVLVATSGQTTRYAYSFHDTGGAPLNALRIRTIDETPPTVPLSFENGLDQSVNTVVKSYFAATGDESLTRTASGRLHYTQYDPVCGRTRIYIHDVAPDSTDASAIINASQFTSSATAATLLNRKSTTTYDLLGREIESVSYRQLRETTWYTALPDGRPVVIRSPHRLGGLYFGPATVAVMNHSGTPVAWGQLAPRFGDTLNILGRVASSSQSPLNWLNLTTTDPMLAIAGNATTTSSSMRARGMHLLEQSDNGGQTLAMRRYHRLAEAALGSSGFGTQRINYDRWSVLWDDYGRSVGSITPAGTTRRQTLDMFGRPLAKIVQAERNAGLTSPHTTHSYEYDNAQAGRDGHLTAMIEHPETGQSYITRLGYDAWGELRAVRRPEAPHLLMRSNNWGQTVAVAALETMQDWGSNPTPSFQEPDAPSLSARRSLITTKFDSRGRMFQRTDWRVNQATGAIGNDCPDCTASELAGMTIEVIYGPEGSIRATTGSQHVVNYYNRACELTESVEVVYLDNSLIRGTNVAVPESVIVGREQYHVDRETGYIDGTSEIRAGCDNSPIGMMPRFDRTASGGFQLSVDPSNGNILGGHRRNFRDQLGRRISDIDFGMPRPNRGTLFDAEYLRPHQRFEPPAYKPVRELTDYLQDDEPADNQYRQSISVLDEFGTPNLISDPAGEVKFLTHDDAGRVTGIGGGNFLNYNQNGQLSTSSCSPDKWQEIEYEDDRVENVKDVCFGLGCATPSPIQEVEILYGDKELPSGPAPIDPVWGQPWQPGSIDNETQIGMLPKFDPAAMPDSPSDHGNIFGLPPIYVLQRTDALGRVTGRVDRAWTLRSAQLDGVGRPSIEYAVPATNTSNFVDSQLRATPMAWSHSYDGLGRRTNTNFLVPNASGDDWINQDEWYGNYNSAGLPTRTDHKHRNFGGTFEMTLGQNFVWSLPEAGTQNYRLSATSADGGGFTQAFDYGPPGSRSFQQGRTIGMSVYGMQGNNNTLPFKTSMCGSGGLTQVGDFAATTFKLPATPPGGGGLPIPGDPQLHIMQRGFHPSMLPGDAEQEWYTSGTNPFGEPSRDRIDWCAGVNCDPQYPTEPLQDTITERDGDGSPIRMTDKLFMLPSLLPELVPLDTEIDETPVCAAGMTVLPGSMSYAPEMEQTASNPSPLPKHIGSLVRGYERWRDDSFGNITQYRRGSEPSSSCANPMTNDCDQQFGDVRVSRTHDPLSRIRQQTNFVVPPTGGPSSPQQSSFRYDIAGNTIDSGGPYLYEYDLLGRLSGVYRRQPVANGPDTRGTLFARFTYDSLGRLRSAAYDLDSDDGDLDNEDVDWYAYDDRWRLVAVHRQDFKYQQVKLRERFVYADRGIAAREGGGPGNKLDCPAYAEFDDDFDGIFERRITYVQDRGGNIVAVFDSSREQFDSPADTTPSQYPVRIAYTAFGEPINVGTAGLGTYEANGTTYDVLDLDFNNDGVIDGSDLGSLQDAVANAGNPNFICTTNGQQCDSPDFNRDGDVDSEAEMSDDVAAFSAALAKQLYNSGTGYSVSSRNIAEYRFLYRGYWYDQHLGIYHVRHRAYDPSIQRWLQPDPAMFVDGLNRYAYCGNRPFSAYDPMGLFSVSEFVGDYLHNAGAGISELGDHLTGATRREDAAWAAMMQMQQSVDKHQLGEVVIQLEAIRDGETRQIVETGVNIVLTIATGGTGTLAKFGASSLGNAAILGAGMGFTSSVASQTINLSIGASSSFSFGHTFSSTAFGSLGGFGGHFLGQGLSKLFMTPDTLRKVYVFWSGGPRAYEAAQRFARMNNGLTIEMTEGGAKLARVDQALRELVGDNEAYELTREAWRLLSADFATEAARHGQGVKFFTSGLGPRIKSVWWDVERDILLRNGIPIDEIWVPGGLGHCVH